jgi:hypothetical protein
MNYQNLFYGVLEKAVSVAALEMLQVNKLIPLDNRNKLTNALKMGAMWTLADELVLLFKLGTCNIFAGNYYIVMDQVFLNSALYRAIEATGIDNIVMDVSDKIPVPQEYQAAIASGIMKVGVKTLSDMIDNQYQNTPLSFLNHPTQLLR